MNLDHITTLEDFKQRITALISCGGEDSSLELNEIFKRYNHGRLLKESKSGTRSDNLKKILIKLIKYMEYRKHPLTMANIRRGLEDFLYENGDDGKMIIERIEYNPERMEGCIYWWQTKGDDRVTPMSKVRERLKRMGVKIISSY